VIAELYSNCRPSRISFIGAKPKIAKGRRGESSRRRPPFFLVEIGAWRRLRRGNGIPPRGWMMGRVESPQDETDKKTGSRAPKAR